MSSSEADLTLVLKARNLANVEVDGLRRKIESSASSIEGHFNTIGDKLVARFHRRDVKELGNAISDSILAVATGGSVADVVGQAGLALAGGLASSFAAQLLAKLASSTLVTTLLGTLTTLGTTLGGFISAAIPVGMALLPVLLVAALGAAIVFLVNNPEIVAKIREVAGSIVSGIIGGLATLGGAILGVFRAAWDLVTSSTIAIVGTIAGFFLGLPAQLIGLGADIVRTIIGGLASFPGEVARVIREAFANLKIDVGPFHIRGTGITIDLPDISMVDPSARDRALGGGFGGRAAGGWAGLHGPELTWLGEKGPEYVRRAGTGTGDQGGGGTGVRIVGVTAADIADMVQRELYFRLRLDAPTMG